MAAFLLCLNILARFGAARGQTKFIMEEYKHIDHNVHSYDSIVPEDIWQFGVVTQMGVHNMTAETYMRDVYPMKPGDKPWLICIVAEKHINFVQSTYIMKTLYFLQRDFSDKANYAFVEAHDEFIREAFDY